MKGRWGRSAGASYRRGSGRNGRAINRELKRRNYRGETVAGEKFGPGRKMLMWPDECAPHVSEVREKKIRDTVSVSFLGCGLLLHTGPKGSPGASFYIFIFFSSFSDFLFLLYLLQKGFKTLQPTFRNFLKFCTLI
jgi:hypothetical protein